MKYDEKYKKVNEKWENGGMFQGKEEYACFMCWEPTVWIEPSWKFNICSDECYNAMCKEYSELTSLGAGFIME